VSEPLHDLILLLCLPRLEVHLNCFGFFDVHVQAAAVPPPVLYTLFLVLLTVVVAALVEAL